MKILIATLATIAIAAGMLFTAQPDDIAIPPQPGLTGEQLVEADVALTASKHGMRVRAHKINTSARPGGPPSRHKR